MFAQAGIDIAPIRKVIEPTNAVLTASRRAGVKVVYLKMEFHPDLSNAGPPESPNWIKHQPLRVGERVTAPDGSQSRILVRDTWNTEILSELRPAPRLALSVSSTEPNSGESSRGDCIIPPAEEYGDGGCRACG